VAQSSIGPVGASVDDDFVDDLADPEFRAEHERLEPFEALARIVIMRRAALGMTQAELARRMRTTPSVISRIESGQHATSARTLKRLAGALDARAVIGFEFAGDGGAKHELVVL
jgi:ribosome-binding protein aMBF1 (putative translation factor)